MAMRITDFATADVACDGALSASFQGSYDRVLLVDGDLALDGELLASLATIAPEGEFEIIAVRGDLTVEGRIRLYEPVPGLIVLGRTRAETLEGGDSEIYIREGTFAYFVYGYYNHGILDTAAIEVPYVINFDHDLRVSAKGALEIDNFGDRRGYDFGSETIAGAFVPEVRARRDPDKIDIEAFFEHLKAGRPVLRDGARRA